MLPPPEVEYASREQLMDTVKTFARGQGYAVTIKVRLQESVSTLNVIEVP